METKAFSIPLVLLLSLMASAGSAISAQENALAVPVTIAVMDQGGAMVSHALIEISPTPSSSPENMYSGNDGKLTIGLTPGTYDLSVTQLGFKRWKQPLEVQRIPNQVVKVTLNIASGSLPTCSGPCGCGGCQGLIVPLEVIPLDVRSTINELLPEAGLGPEASHSASAFDGKSWWNHVKFLADDKIG